MPKTLPAFLKNTDALFVSGVCSVLCPSHLDLIDLDLALVLSLSLSLSQHVVTHMS